MIIDVYKYRGWHYCTHVYIIPAKPLHNHHNMLSVHFNHFYCTEIWDKLRRDLAMITYIYPNVDDCWWLTSSIPQQRFKLYILLNYYVIPENIICWRGLLVWLWDAKMCRAFISQKIAYWADEFSTDAFGEMLSKNYKCRSSTKMKCFATPPPPTAADTKFS